MTSQAPHFSLPNAAVGPDPFSPSAIEDETDFLVLLFQRDHYCTNCRKQVQAFQARIDEFHERDAEVASIVPEPLEKVAEWQENYELPYPLLADPDTEVGEAYDQPVRFGVLGDVSDFLGRMPEAVVLDLRGESHEIVYAYRGRSTFDRPEVDDLLAELDDVREPNEEPPETGD